MAHRIDSLAKIFLRNLQPGMAHTFEPADAWPCPSQARRCVVRRTRHAAGDVGRARCDLRTADREHRLRGLAEERELYTLGAPEERASRKREPKGSRPAE